MKGIPGFILKIRKGMLSLLIACFLVILIKFLVDPNARSNLAQMIFPVTIVKTEQTEQISRRHATQPNILHLLAEVAAAPPIVSVNQTCLPRPLPRYPDCTTQPAFTGELFEKPRKIILMMLFSYELDILEIALKEQQDLVDKIFLVESSATHKGSSKPLVWEREKFSERFSFVNKSKVMHIVADEGITEEWKDNIWAGERAQTDTGVSRVRDWAANTGELEDDDVFISADVDEIMSSSALHQLKWCKTSAAVMSGGLWMPMGNLNKAIRAGFHVEGKPHAFSFPTIYNWKNIQTKDFEGRRLFDFDFQGQHVTGGFHMTNNAFLPTSLLKEVSNGEDNFFGGNIHIDYLLNMDLEDTAIEQDRLYNLYYRQMWAELLDPVNTVKDIELELPWFLDCNRERFPYWFGKPDGRNEILLEKIFLIKHHYSKVKFGRKRSSHLFSQGYYARPGSDKSKDNGFITINMQ